MKFLLPILLVSFLNAEEVDTLNGIYMEAILFVIIFGIMSIISIIVSKKDAKEFESENTLKDKKKEIKKEEIEDIAIVSKKSDSDRLIELSKMLEDGLILEKEFEILKINLYQTKKELF